MLLLSVPDEWIFISSLREPIAIGYVWNRVRIGIMRSAYMSASRKDKTVGIHLSIRQIPTVQLSAGLSYISCRHRFSPTTRAIHSQEHVSERARDGSRGTWLRMRGAPDRYVTDKTLTGAVHKRCSMRVTDSDVCNNILLLKRFTGDCLKLCNCTVWVKKIPLRFSDFFPKRLGIFSPNFTRLLYVPIYANDNFLFNYLQLWRRYAILSATSPPSLRFGRWWTFWA